MGPQNGGRYHLRIELIFTLILDEMFGPVWPAKPLLTITALTQNERMVKMTNCKTHYSIYHEKPNIPYDMTV